MHVREVAFAAPLRAVVIHVSTLLDFRRHGASVVSAGEQPGEGKMVLAVFRLVPPGKGILHALEQFRRNQRLVRAFVLDTLPNESARVDGVFQTTF